MKTDDAMLIYSRLASSLKISELNLDMDMDGLPIKERIKDLAR